MTIPSQTDTTTSTRTSNGVNVLSIGSDRGLVNPLSETARRHIAYGAHFDRLSLIVLTTTAHAKVALSESVHVYPTNSRSKLTTGIDAFRIAWSLARPDVVTVQDPFESGLIGWIIARIRRARFHVQIHADLYSPEFRARNRIRTLIAWFVLRRADRIRVVSYRIQESLERMHATRSPITVLPIYVPIEKFRTAHAGMLAGRFARFRFRFLVVARLESEKNVGLAIDAFVKAAPHETCLIIVGEGRERRSLEQQVAKLGAAARIFFEGQTDPTPYYAASDLVLVPSLHEGYGLVIIEALAARKPVLSTDVGVAREAGAIVTDTRHFVEALSEWCRSGPRVGDLQHYPYRSFDEYVAAYAEDIIATKKN